MKNENVNGSKEMINFTRLETRTKEIIMILRIERGEI